jgi:tripartite-type tricarboxylate transporter receptor subunit TctC
MERRNEMRNVKMTNIFLILLMAVLFLSMGTISPIWGADYPKKPIKIVCPFGAGSGADRIVRVAIPFIEKALGQEMVMIYKAGGGGVVGANYYMTTRPDGYTLMVYNQPHIMIQERFMKVAFSTSKLIPLLGLTDRPEIIMVKATSPFKAFQDLVKYAKQNPGKLTIGNTGTFTSNHLTYAMMSKAVGIDLTRVAFASGGKMNAALLGDQIDATVSNRQWLTLHEGKLRPLVSASIERVIPDVPTFKELGYEGVINAASNFIFTREGTPAPIVTYLSEKLAPLRSNLDLKKEYIEKGIDYGVFDHQQCQTMMKEIMQHVEETKDLLVKGQKK